MSEVGDCGAMAGVIRDELKRSSVAVSVLGGACLLVSVCLAMFAGSPWVSTRWTWTAFAVLALVRSQATLARINEVVREVR